MKRILQLGLVCVAIGIIAASTSCQKAYNADPYPGQDTTKNPMRGDFTAIVDGVSFVANSKYASDHTDNNGIRTITVSGIMDSKAKDPQNNQSISITITNYNGPGIYPIQMGTAGIYLNQVNGTYTNYLAKTDSAALIQITNDQGTIDGNFNFVVAPNGLGTADNHNISNGSFSVPK